MVLQTSNNSKRYVSNAENTPPKPSVIKSQSNHLRNSISAASRRRRARTIGGPHLSRHTVEYAAKHRRTTTKSNSIRFEVGPLPPAITDVAMGEPSTAHAKPTIHITLPKELSRPEWQQVSKEVIEAIEPELKAPTMDYIRDILEDVGPAMLQVLAGIQATPVKSALPKELSVLVNNFSSDMPTHMLAVYSRQQPAAASSATRNVTLYPIHNIVFASHCAHLPKLPLSPKQFIPELPGSSITLPVVPLCIPSPEMFPQLSGYLYTRRTTTLLTSLLPCAPPPSTPLTSKTIPEFSHKLAITYTTHALLQHAMKVNGLWRNVCALGVFDHGIWDAMDLAWEVLLTALAIANGRGELMMGEKNSSSS